MRLLILSFYYPPDLSAGSFRTGSLISTLKEKIDENSRVDIVTTYPNRYNSYDVNVSLTENEAENIQVLRIKLPPHKSGMVDQALAFFRYFFKSQRLVKKKKYDMVFATSSRLFTAFLGSYIARKKDIPLFLDIRDIFLDTLNSIMNSWQLFILKPIIAYIERFTMKQANHINLVSEGFKEYFIKKYPNKSFSYFTNGIDEEFLGYDFNKTTKSNKKVITYAGNIGEGQGLHQIVPFMAEYLGIEYEFHIYGDGGKKNELLQILEERQIKNIKISSPVSRDKLKTIYKESDYLFLHLNDYDAFKKVLPSKIFEYGATGKPVVAGVSGFSAQFIKHNLPSWIVFEPTNLEDFKKEFKKDKNSLPDNNVFKQQFNRFTIMNKLVEQLDETYRNVL
jgi:glycosyltransferase involved in cell wall biosynthesis